MRLLLDTHVVLWWLVDDPTLSDEVKDQIDGEPEIFVSSATLWELSIKQVLGKIQHPKDLPERVRDCGINGLAIHADHAIAAGRLPRIHRDPFDRMLVAQARYERLTLATREAAIQRYDVDLLAV